MADRKIKEFKLNKDKSVIPNGELNGSYLVFDPVYDNEPLTPDTDVSPYSTALQGKPIHGLLSASTREKNRDNIAHVDIIESDGVSIIIDEEAIGDLSSQTSKTLIILLRAVTKQLPRDNSITAEAINRGRIVQLSLNDYMAACRISDTKTAREQLNNSIRALYGVSLEWDEPKYEVPEGKSRKVKVTKHHRMRITDHTITEEEGNPVRGGVAEFRFSFDMAEYLCNAYIQPFPDLLLSVNTRYHPYSFPLGWKLCSLYNMDYGKAKANTTTVKTLLNAAKEIPRYNDIAKQGHIYERIISRLDRDLAELVRIGVLSVYWYYNDKGERIESGYYKDGEYIESNALGLMSYTDFSALHIHYELKDYPDQTPRLEAKRKRIRAAISRRKTAAKNKKQTATGTGDGAQ